MTWTPFELLGMVLGMVLLVVAVYFLAAVGLVAIESWCPSWVSRGEVTMQLYRFAVTFESLTQPPRTVRGAVSAGRLPGALAKAAHAAMAVSPGQRWASVSVLIEREAGEEPALEPAEDAEYGISDEQPDPARG